MTDFGKHDNYSNPDEDDEEDGIVEYLEIDSEVMETFEDPNDYFAQINQQDEIYVQENIENAQQLSLVIQNSTNEYTSLKQTSPQFDNHNGLMNVLWPNNMIKSNDNKATVRNESPCKFAKGSSTCRGHRTQKSKVNVSSENNSQYINRKNMMMMTKGLIQSEDDSLDLFFQSMAQTVSHLPSQIQAKIKMEICKVISMAEIKYCSRGNISHDNSNQDFNPEN